MSSFYTSPIEYLEECIQKLKNEMKVADYDRELYGNLMGFYGDMIERLECPLDPSQTLSFFINHNLWKYKLI